MADYIDREQAIKAAIDAVDDWDGGGNRFRAKIIKQAIEDLPVADVRDNVHGHWKMHDICSVCDDLNEFQTNYCPNCGARMDEE